MRAPPRPRTLATVLALALAAGACASAPEGPAARLAGCYQFRWDAGARALGLPWGFVLHDDPLPGGWPLLDGAPGVRLAETATSPTGRLDHPFGYWRLSGDSVEVGHPGGGGFTLSLVPDQGDLVGSGRAVGDALRPGEPAGPRAAQPVRAHRVLCGAR